MAADTRQNSTSIDDTRVEFARLQLRLRQAERRLAEADTAAVDPEEARAALVARLGPMLDKRRTEMDAELDSARLAAVVLVDEARQKADEVVAAAEQRATHEQARIAEQQAAFRRQAELQRIEEQQRAAEQARLAEAQRIVEQQRLIEQERLAEQARAAENERLAEQARLAEQQRLADEAAAAFEQQLRDEQQASVEQLGHDDEIFRPKRVDPDRGRPAQPAVAAGQAGNVDRRTPGVQMERRAAPPQPNVAGMNDPEVFARAVATIVSAVLGERAQAVPQVVVQAAPAPVKVGFWASARHLDVLLLGLTTMIVLVVLAAWLA